VSLPKFPARLCKSLLRTWAVVNEPHKDQLVQTRLSHLSSTVTLPSLVGIYPFQEELFCYQSFCIKPLWVELWYNKPFYCSVVGSAVVGRAFLLQTVVARIVVQQSVVGSAVARAAVEPNWDLHISPARSGKRGPMSQRGTSFGTNIEGLVLVSLVPILVPLTH
jgi:hypothetical protein